LIDLHSHILPGVDDGARDLADALDIGRLAVDNGIQVMACTPHFMPGVYDNESNDIRARVEHLNQELLSAGIDLALVEGSDAHVRPDFVQCLRDRTILTLHSSRYVLFEPPHNIMPPRLADLLHNIQMAGFVPILTHPERLRWIEQDYDFFVAAAQSGVWMQITAGSLTGRFGKRPQYWGMRMLSEGLVSILATDAHNTRSRPPLLAEGREIAIAEVGLDEATQLVVTRPGLVLENADPQDVPATMVQPTKSVKKTGFWQRLLGGSTS
jgi:protein-tyrosine phosphatase